MTVSSIKVKVVRRPSLKLKVLPRFPANVVAQNFLTVTKANGTYTFSVDYTLLTPGPITDPTTAYVALLDATAGVYKEVSLSSLLTSGLDADLQAIAALTGTGILARTADGTWALRTLTAPAAGITITNPAGVAGNPTLVLANDLAAVEGLASNGMAARTATDTWAVRTITAGASIGVTNGDGVAGNPTIAVTDAELVALAGLVSAADQVPYFTGSGTASLASFPTFGRSIVAAASQAAARTVLALTPGTDVQAFDSDLAALAANAGTGLWSVTGAGTGSVRTLTGPAAGITVTNGGGVAGNPTLVLANDLAAVEGLSSTGIARRTATDTWSVGTAVSNAELAAMAAWTIKGNVTSGSATPTDFTIDGLTVKASPAAADEIIIWDVAGAAIKKASVSSLASAGSVASIDAKTGSFTTGNGLDSTAGNIIELTAARRTLPTVQTFTSGTAATYTTPAGCLWLEVSIIGGGGGGGGSGTGSTAGGTGGTSTFNSINAIGGSGGAAGIAAGTVFAGGLGGTAGTGTATQRAPGSAGNNGEGGVSGTLNAGGGNGGLAHGFGSGGRGAVSNASPGSAGVGFGGGGGGGGTGAAAGVSAGGGGGGGEVAYVVIGGPSSTYTYTIGAVGSAGGAGTSGNAGGAGAAGYIQVIEHYGS